MGLESGLAALNGDEQAAETSCISLACDGLEVMEGDDVLFDEDVDSPVVIFQQRNSDIEARVARLKRADEILRFTAQELRKRDELVEPGSVAACVRARQLKLARAERE